MKCLQDQENNLEIYHYITFRTTCTRTGSTGHMLNINYTRTSAARHFYFNRIVLLWNSVQPAINLNDSFKVVRYKLINFLWSHFVNHYPHCLLTPCFKVAENLVTFKVDKPGIQADRLLCLVKIVANTQFWESECIL